jgi:hypothetical protein
VRRANAMIVAAVSTASTAEVMRKNVLTLAERYPSHAAWCVPRA